jgi:large subunit ribosomal protein L6|tara:strand:- start:2205 stop:2738 length:534 start_codon:yes stop_codon:yes gene_type:complete
VSRIGKHPVAIPDGVEVAVAGQMVTVKGKLGELSRTLADEVEVAHEDAGIRVSPRGNGRRSRAMWGLSRSLVNNMVTGVSEGFSRSLAITGVGYRAAADGDFLSLQLGYSHEIKLAIPGDLKIICEQPTEITVNGIDKQRVGEMAAEIRRLRKPEPFNGKGVRYSDEYVRRKEGKKK